MDFAPTPRRGFLARMAGAVAAVTAGSAFPRAVAAEPAQASPNDRWLDGLTGRHRCLFDFPQHGDGLPLIHVLNYVNTYRTAYGEPASSVNAVGTFYGAPGPPASIPLAWNDVVWEKYKIGELLKLTDPATKAPSKRNMFNRPRSGDPVLFGGAVALAGIESLQRMGVLFLMCNNAFQAWMGFLSGNGTKGNAATIERDIRANLLPGVVTVPAMVIAIEKAQGTGIAYNRQ
jgi:intracellular sulfur oxidation DsrE/DsrF family protein